MRRPHRWSLTACTAVKKDSSTSSSQHGRVSLRRSGVMGGRCIITCVPGYAGEAYTVRSRSGGSNPPTQLAATSTTTTTPTMINPRQR